MTAAKPEIAPLNAEATLAVQELRRQELNWAEITRLCAIPNNYHAMQRLAHGTAKKVSAETCRAIIDGYQRYLDGDRDYIARKPQPITIVPKAPERRVVRPVRTIRATPQKRAIKPVAAKQEPPVPIVAVIPEPIFTPRPSLRERLAARLSEKGRAA